MNRVYDLTILCQFKIIRLYDISLKKYENNAKEQFPIDIYIE